MPIVLLLTGFLASLFNPVFLYAHTLRASSEETVIDARQNSSTLTKRIWFFITNKEYQDSDSHLVLKCKESEFSGDEISPSLYSIANYDGGIYYYADIPINYDGIRLEARHTNGGLVASTKWKFVLRPSMLYEVYSSSNIMRHRTANISHPNSTILAAVLTAYFTNLPAFENGYSAFREIKETWLDRYVGDVYGRSLSNTFLWDSPQNQIPSETTPRDRLVSVETKIKELQSNYDNLPTRGRGGTDRLKLIGTIFFLATLILTAGILVVFHRLSRGKKA